MLENRIAWVLIGSGKPVAGRKLGPALSSERMA